MAVVGMAGGIQSHAAAAFARSFHLALSEWRKCCSSSFSGSTIDKKPSALQYDVESSGDYSRPSNVIPFPSTEEARARLNFRQTERHLTDLDEEFAALVDMSDCEPSEWAVRTAVPAVRLDDESQTAFLRWLPPGPKWARFLAPASQTRRGVPRASRLPPSLRRNALQAQRLQRPEGGTSPRPRRAWVASTRATALPEELSKALQGDGLICVARPDHHGGGAASCKLAAMARQKVTTALV